MLRSREEILKQCGELIDMVGELFDEKIKYERKFCEESRKRKEAEIELADKNFRIMKALEYIEKNKHLSMFADLRKEEGKIYDLECVANELEDILNGGTNE